MAENFFDRFDEDEDSGFIDPSGFFNVDPRVFVEAFAPQSPAPQRRSTENYFDRYDNDPDARRIEEPFRFSPTPGVSFGYDDDGEIGGLLTELDHRNRRESAKELTKVERQHPNAPIVTPKRDGDAVPEASFWGALEHGLGNRNLLAYADTFDHMADSASDPSYAQSYRQWAQSVRQAVEVDGSSYRPIYQSFRDIGGLGDLWGFTKETMGDQLGLMLPSIAGAALLGSAGEQIGRRVGGKFGGVVGGVGGGITGAMSGSIHLHVSEMRNALLEQKVEGEQLTSATNFGAAVLASLDAIFPTVAVLKIDGPARTALARRVAREIAARGAISTPAEFVRRFGTTIVRETLETTAKYELSTEVAQEAFQEFYSTKAAGKDITGEQLRRFATETLPETAIRTMIGAGPIAVPGSTAQTYRQAEYAATKQRADAYSKVAAALDAAKQLETAENPQAQQAAETELALAAMAIANDPVAAQMAQDLLTSQDQTVSATSRQLTAQALRGAIVEGGASVGAVSTAAKPRKPRT